MVTSREVVYQQRKANLNKFSLLWHLNDFFTQRIADTECFSVRLVLSIGGRSMWSPTGSVSLYLSIAWLSAQVSLWQLGWLILWAEPGRGTASRWAVPVHPARAQGQRQGPGSLGAGHSWHVPPLPISIIFISCYVRVSTSANSCILTISNPLLSWRRQTHSFSNRYNRCWVSQVCCFVRDHAGFKSLSFFVFSLYLFLKACQHILSINNVLSLRRLTIARGTNLSICLFKTDTCLFVMQQAEQMLVNTSSDRYSSSPELLDSIWIPIWCVEIPVCLDFKVKQKGFL